MTSWKSNGKHVVSISDICVTYSAGWQVPTYLLDGIDESANQETKYNFLIKDGLERLNAKTKFEEGLEGLSKGIETVRTFVDQAVKVSPEASLVWAGVCVVLPFLTNFKEASDARRDGFSYVTERLRYYLVLANNLYPDGSQRSDWNDQSELQGKLHEGLVTLFEKLLELQIKIVLRLYYRSVAKDIFQLENWSQMNENIRELEATFNSDLHQVSSAVVQHTLRQIQRNLDQGNVLLDNLLEAQREQLEHTKEMLELMSKRPSEETLCHQLFRLATEDRDESYESYRSRIPERVDGTCAWFLSHPSYIGWLDEPNHPLILSADPGSGKSVLTRYMVDSRLEGKRPDDVVCYFFFDGQTQKTVRQALCAMIHQLVTQRFSVISHAMLAYRGSKDNLINVTSGLWDIFSRMITSSSIDRVIAIVDALDECRSTECKDFVEGLQQLWLKARGKFSFFATTRPSMRVMPILRPLIHNNPHILIAAADWSEAIAQEVNVVIETRATELQMKDLLDEDTKLHLIRRLQESPQRTYLWVHLIFEYIENNDVENSKRSIDEIIYVPPKSVYEVYEKMISTSRNKTRARKAFCVILAASRALTLQEFHIAMQLDSASREPPEPYRNLELTLRNWCGLLVTIRDNRVYLLHQTTRDFLARMQFSSDDGTDGGPISTIESHRVLAWSCVSFLEITVAATLRRSGHSKKTDSSIGDSAKESSGFLDYSTSNWYYHIQEARLDGDMALMKRIRRLCDPKNKHCKMWLEAHKHYIADFQVDFRDVNVLWIASYTGMTSLAEHILEEGDDCDTRNPQGQNAILIAAFRGNDRVLTVLLKSKRIKRDVRDSRRTCPLQAAFISHNPAAIKVLLESGTDAGAWDLWGITPFENAIWHGSDELIRAFVDCGKSEVFNATNVRGKTPLMIACELGRTALVRDMIDSGSCDVNIQDSIGKTALAYSVLFEEAEIV